MPERGLAPGRDPYLGSRPWRRTSGAIRGAPPGSRRTRSAEDDGGGGIGGFFGNLVDDAGDAIVGLGFRGDVRECGRRIYEHPLAPIFDATAVLSGGTTAAALLDYAIQGDETIDALLELLENYRVAVASLNDAVQAGIARQRKAALN